ncbi:hypothetical protein M758_8G008400 [Ceratodon purpureus]|uniref:Uncharacterized protein n=1 Tax=Ceratodon purpureus TaxID=3225 RepID=A0A8T0GY32_CERPU|nr:hypothetical protein KC19_8G009000 [Ceratodon purpureus]KAG0607184.1 hypothetical protein M758_8G008400 [Ceratodon purpureus]
MLIERLLPSLRFEFRKECCIILVSGKGALSLHVSCLRRRLQACNWSSKRDLRFQSFPLVCWCLDLGRNGVPEPHESWLCGCSILLAFAAFRGCVMYSWSLLSVRL